MRQTPASPLNLLDQMKFRLRKLLNLSGGQGRNRTADASLFRPQTTSTSNNL